MADYGSLSFAEQIAFFQAKLNLPTARWDDLLRAAHDRAFVVAGAMQADLLADLREAVRKGIEDGATLEQFRKDFARIVEKNGWTGWTGEGTAGGEAWRTKVIYETNLRSSYAAGRYQQMQAIKERRPYWRYRHNDSVINPRPEHLALDGKIVHADDPFWQTHFPPNGWGCFPGSTQVRSDARLGQRFFYSGQLVELQTRLGNRLSVTPNHPILTSQGWVAAGEIKTGDQVLSASTDIDAALVWVVDHPQAPVSAAQLFEALRLEGFRIAPMAPDDFHGDALGGESEIEIAGSERALGDVLDAARRQHVRKLRLDRALRLRAESADNTGGSPQQPLIVADSVLAQNAADRRLGESESSGNGGLAGQAAAVEREDLSLRLRIPRIGDPPRALHEPLAPTASGALVSPAPERGIAPSALGDAMTLEHARQGASAESKLYGELLEANAGLVAADEVTLVSQFDWFGHVYDFTTTTSLQVAGGLIVSNCKCYVETLAARDLERLGIDPDSLQAPEVIIDPKTGDPVGIDKGWGYAPGRTWWPNLEKYPFDTARAMVNDYAADGVMQRWFDRVAEQVAALMALPVSAGLGGDALVRAWRQAGLIPDERLPMAVISPEVRARLGTERQVVMLSADTLIKQMVKRQGQGHAASWYETLQGMLDGASVVTQDGANKAIYWRQADKLWMAVVKTTAARDEVYLVSLHEVNAAYAKARIPRDQWERIGVA